MVKLRLSAEAMLTGICRRIWSPKPLLPPKSESRRGDEDNGDYALIYFTF